MRKRKLIALVVTAAMTLSMLAACGSAKQEAGTTTKAAQIIASIVGSLVCIYIMLFLIRYTVEKDIF